MGLREGPEQPSVKPLFGDPNINGMKVQKSSWNAEAVTVNVSVFGAKWYFQVKVEDQCSLRVGWATARHKSTDNSSPQLGSDLYSWAYDGCTSVYYNNQRQHYGSGDVRRGDIIGVGVDFDRRCMQFWKNGRSLGPIFHGFHADGGLIPTLHIERRGTISFELNAKSPDTAFCPIVYKPTKEQQEKMEDFYNEYFTSSVTLRGSTGGESGSLHDAIRGDGTLQLASDLGVEELTDPTLLIVAWKFASSRTWEFTRDEFIGALSVYKIYSIDQLKEKIKEWKKDLENDNVFKDFYFFLFDYLREDKTQLLTEEALMVWSTVEMEKKWKLFPEFVKFLEEEGKKTISKDSWRQLLDFSAEYKENFDNFDETSAWPLLFDEFVEWVQDQ